ncbi:MAG TPA: 3-isopropylmalate dehydratase [candidate division Zixibacteria bacterium]|nr:3-isopropylmalate dehydratase [candidate division Zixibacteria bacterium]
MTKAIILKGKAVVVRDDKNKPIDDIDTDMIFHNKYLHITEITEMGQYTFDNLEGWKDFAKKAKKGDILFLGANFGSGSSRQQAVDCFTALGIQTLIAKSFGAIYKRNAINAGMPLIMADIIDDLTKISTGDEVEVNLASGLIKNITKGIEYQAQKMSNVQMDIYQAGDLFTYAKNL